MFHRCSSLPIVALLSLVVAPARGEIVDFEDLPLAPESAYAGANNTIPDPSGYGFDGSFQSGANPATFNTYYDDLGYQTNGVEQFYWAGWAYSNTTDTTTPNYTNQFSAITGSGYDGSKNYVVGYSDGFDPNTIVLPAGVHPLSVQVTSTTYAYHTIVDPNVPGGFPSQFHTGDSMVLTAQGLDAGGNPVGPSDTFTLADYTSPNPAQHYVVTSWENFNLSNLSSAAQISFSVASTNPYAATYFAIDNLSLTSQYGDVNNDGIVNIGDLTMVGSHWLNTGPVGDANGDGIVNIADLTDIGSHWLQGTSIGPLVQGAAVVGQPVPEPSSIILALGALASLFGWIKMRK